jgi:hypothetical protein
MDLGTQHFTPALHADSNLPSVFDEGVVRFSILFTRWMDTNEWSHPTMTVLAKAACGKVGWLHSSQISGLRHAKLKSPGPRTFVAIERLNFYLYRYLTTKKLIPNTSSSNHYANGWAVLEDGRPPSVGWWMEIFCGVRLPKDIDLDKHSFTNSDALKFSEGFGRRVRALFRARGLDIIEDLRTTVHKYYTAGDDTRVEKVSQVVLKKAVWTPEELSYEMPALLSLTSALNGPETEDQLLQEVGLIGGQHTNSTREST